MPRRQPPSSELLGRFSGFRKLTFSSWWRSPRRELMMPRELAARLPSAIFCRWLAALTIDLDGAAMITAPTARA
jgi:hypothetical protein